MMIERVREDTCRGACLVASHRHGFIFSRTRFQGLPGATHCARPWGSSVEQDLVSVSKMLTVK